jgi:hypothetical protein
MLLHGLHPEKQNGSIAPANGAADTSAQELACQELGAAMVALLPGIDANDEKKALATLEFYLSVLSNCVAFTGQDYPAKEGEAVIELGFYVEEFVLGFLQRFFGLMRDLSTSGGAAVDGSSEQQGLHHAPMSWLSSCNKVQPLLDELFSKMPKVLLPLVVRKVREFALSVSDLQLAADGHTLMVAAAAACKDVAAQEFLKPLAQSVETSLGLAGVLHGRLTWMMA